MRKTAYVLLTSALFLGGASFALADAPAIGFWCSPYATSFVEGQAYIPGSDATCSFTLDPLDSGSFRTMGIYEGVVGSSTNIGGRWIAFPGQVEPQYAQNGIPFQNFTFQPGEPFFAAADTTAFGDFDYLLQGIEPPPPDLHVIHWYWGTPATVTADSHTIAVGEAIPPLTATISGFIDGENLGTSGITGEANCIASTTDTNTAGDFPINCSRGTLSSTKYAFDSFVAGTLHITSSGGDTQPPVIVITTPADGHSYLQNDYVSISATITDTDATTTAIYLLNGVPVDPNAQLPLAVGPATLVISATDTSGNTGYATSTFTVLPPDLTAPVVTITNPISGAIYTDAANVFLISSVTDASPIVATSYTFNGATIDPLQPLPLLGAPLGPASVSVAATDAYGNAASTTVNFIIKSSDIVPPTITITNPIAGNTYLSTDSVLAAATVTDASGVASVVYTLDGMTIDPLLPLPLAVAGAGPALLVVTATDNFANTASSSVAFTIVTPPPPDTQAPVVTIISPMAGKKYGRHISVLISANITDSSTIANVQYLFNGKPVNPAVPLNFKKAPLGKATVSVIATDAFGNVGSSTVTFRILPGSNSCIEDITEAFDHKWISNKNVFRDAFEDCKKIHDRENDRDDYDNDNHRHGKDSNKDDRYLKSLEDIQDAFDDIDRNINR